MYTYQSMEMEDELLNVVQILEEAVEQKSLTAVDEALEILKEILNIDDNSYDILNNDDLL